MTLRNKYIIVFGGSTLVSIILIGIVILFFTKSRLDSLMFEELITIRNLIVKMSLTGFEINQKRVNKGIKVFDYFIKNKITINEQAVDNIIIENQTTNEIKRIKLPRMTMNGEPLYKDVELVDRTARLVGGETTIFQMTDDGLIRIATSVRNYYGKRAINTYIPPDSEVYQAILNNKNYIGRAEVLKEWYLTAYLPIYDQKDHSRIIGCIFVGIRQTNMEALRKKILNITFLNQGYSYIIDLKGNIVIHPEISNINVMNYYDVNSKKYFQEMIQDIQSQRLQSKIINQEEQADSLNHAVNQIIYTEIEMESNKKVNRIAYYTFLPEMEWIIAVCVREQDIRSALAIVIRIILLVGLLFIFLNLILTIRSSNFIVKPILQIVHSANEVTKGNLSIRKIRVKSKDEVNSLAHSFNMTIEKLKELVKQIYIAILTITKNLRVLYKSTFILTQSAYDQVDKVEKTVNNFDRINKMVHTVSKESNKGNDYAQQAVEKAKIGLDSMKKLENEMLKIENSSREISEIIVLINDIAEQTNLLSLNASIESARSGEAGKGFNIVAVEIRKLAEKSTYSANKIHRLILNNNKIIQKGVQYTKDTAQILKEISFSNELISQVINKISTEAERVTIRSGDTIEAIHHITNLAHDNLKHVENVSKTMTLFVDQAVLMQKFVGQFDTRTEQIKGNQKRLEKILAAKTVDVEKFFNKFGTHFELIDQKIKIGDHEINQLKLGNTIITNNKEFIDQVSSITQTSVTLFQIIDEAILRVATTVQRFDENRAIGTVIESDNEVYQTVLAGKNYYGRAFVVNRWYVALYQPIYDKKNQIIAVLYLGIPEIFNTTRVEEK